MPSQRIHIVPHEQGWAIKREGQDKLQSTHATQKEAIDAGRDLARDDEVDLVVHRQDGTFRNVLTYTNDMNERTTNGNGNGNRVQAHDVFQVGSRVSWGAIAAGAAIALTVNAILWMGGLAIGISVVDRVSGRMLTVWSAIWLLVSTLIAMFLGGLVVSRVTTGEDKTEAVLYGVILWGFMAVCSLALAGAGLGTGAQLASLRPLSGSDPWLNNDNYREMQLSDAQVEKAEAIKSRARESAGDLHPTAAAWWAFTTLVLSLGAAVGGSLLGAGPEFMLRRFRTTRTATQTGTMQPA